MKKFTTVATSVAALSAPFMALAVTTATNVLTKVQDILDIVIPIVITLALIYFLWGVASYIMSSGDEEKRKEARNVMIWGIIALFVMVSVWGLVRFIGNTFDIGQDQTITLPRVR